MKKFLTRFIPLVYGFYFNSLAIFSSKKAAKKAFMLFCSPRKGKVLPHQKEYLDQAKHEIISTNGVALQTYKWEGKKEIILLLHGWESNVFRWRNLIDLLVYKNYTIIAFDAPAHGNSTGNILNVPLYTSCTAHLISKYQPTHIIGHSIGGMTTMYNQYKNPNTYIQKVISLGAPSDLSLIMEQYEGMLQLNTKVMQALDDYFMEHFNFNIDEFSIANFVKATENKGLLVHDELDVIAPVTASEKIHANWKNSKLIKTKGFGHSLHQNEVNQHILEFLES
ncbi:MAG: alpha/beta hydrolase [Cellulophaga sp.]